MKIVCDCGCEEFFDGPSKAIVTRAEGKVTIFEPYECIECGATLVFHTSANEERGDEIIWTEEEVVHERRNGNPT